MVKCQIDKRELEQIRDIIDQNRQPGVSFVDTFYSESEKEFYCILKASDVNLVKKYFTDVNITYDFVTPIESIHTQEEENKEKFEIIGELSTKLAHDIRNPLSIIKNIIEILETKPKLDIEERDIYYGRLHRAVNRISYQIEDVLDFVRPAQTSFERYLLNDILASALDKITKPDTIKIKMPTNFVYAMCDFTKMEVVFTNLLMNAIQAINDFGQIEIELVDDGDATSIRISDTGCGISHDVLPKIFEPLFTTKQTGTGLGLPSCKQIVERHYGTIKASSKVGVGTTFTITLPKDHTELHTKTELIQTR